FIGPALADGFLRMLAKGVDHFVTLVVFFSTTQNLGGIAGAALLGSFQAISARVHAASLAEHVTGFDPQVIARVQGGAASLAGAINDPLARATQGAGLLAQSLTREANVLAFNDTFLFVAVMAGLTALYVAYGIAFNAIRPRQAKPSGTTS